MPPPSPPPFSPTPIHHLARPPVWLGRGGDKAEGHRTPNVLSSERRILVTKGLEHGIPPSLVSDGPVSHPSLPPLGPSSISMPLTPQMQLPTVWCSSSGRLDDRASAPALVVILGAPLCHTNQLSFRVWRLSDPGNLLWVEEREVSGPGRLSEVSGEQQPRVRLQGTSCL